MRDRVQLRFLLHAEQQKSEEQCEETGMHSGDRRAGTTPKVATSVAEWQKRRNARRINRSTEVRRYIPPVAYVGAMTRGAMPIGAGSSIVIRHSVRASSGSISVAECNSDALSQMTTSPTP